MRGLRLAFDGRSLASPVLRGWHRYAIGLVEALTRRGAEVTLFHRTALPLHEANVAHLGCRTAGLRDRGGLYYEQVSVPWALARGGFDLFHAPFEHGVPLVAPCPVVLTLHSATSHSYRDLVERGHLPGRVRDYLGYDIRCGSPASLYWRAQIPRADHILTPSEFSRQEIIRLLHTDPSRVSATPLAIPEPFCRPPRPEATRAATLRRLGLTRPFLLYVGGYEPHKNVRGTLDAFARVHAARPELSLVLVGTNAILEEDLGAARGLGLRPGRDVFFLVDLGEELPDIYDAAELLLTLSWRETFCLPLLEAMARGLPVVASSWGAAPEVVCEAGRLVDPRDPEAAAGAVFELLAADRSETRRASLDQAGRFDWDRVADQTLDVYEGLLERRAARRRRWFVGAWAGGGRPQPPPGEGGYSPAAKGPREDGAPGLSTGPTLARASDPP